MLHNRHLRPALTLFLANESDTLELGRRFARCLRPGMVVYLLGELGAGKTTLVRGILRALGFTGRVKSPTFSLVEVYEVSSLYLYHFDFYRFVKGSEWRESGLDEHFNADSVCLVEWAEKAAGLPDADVRIRLDVQGSGRGASIEAATEAGTSCLKGLQE